MSSVKWCLKKTLVTFPKEADFFFAFICWLVGQRAHTKKQSFDETWMEKIFLTLSNFVTLPHFLLTLDLDGEKMP